jgi:hypothetical protein
MGLEEKMALFASSHFSLRTFRNLEMDISLKVFSESYRCLTLAHQRLQWKEDHMQFHTYSQRYFDLALTHFDARQQPISGHDCITISVTNQLH